MTEDGVAGGSPEKGAREAEEDGGDRDGGDREKSRREQTLKGTRRCGNSRPRTERALRQRQGFANRGAIPAFTSPRRPNPRPSSPSELDYQPNSGERTRPRWTSSDASTTVDTSDESRGPRARKERARPHAGPGMPRVRTHPARTRLVLRSSTLSRRSCRMTSPLPCRLFHRVRTAAVSPPT